MQQRKEEILKEKYKQFTKYYTGWWRKEIKLTYNTLLQSSTAHLISSEMIVRGENEKKDKKSLASIRFCFLWKNIRMLFMSTLLPMIFRLGVRIIHTKQDSKTRFRMTPEIDIYGVILIKYFNAQIFEDGFSFLEESYQNLNVEKEYNFRCR